MTRDRQIPLVNNYLRRVEDIVLVLVAVVLAILALLLLITTAVALFTALTGGTMRDATVEILDRLLLVMITMEIFYTVTLTLQSHTLTAEPFLIVGAIAAVRRLLVITATTIEPGVDPNTLMWTMVELALLSLIVIAIAVSVYILRKGQQYPSEKMDKDKPPERA